MSEDGFGGSSAQRDAVTEFPVLSLGAIGTIDGYFGRQDCAWGILRQVGQACCLVDRITDHCVLEPGLCPHVAGDGPTGCDADRCAALGDFVEKSSADLAGSRECASARLALALAGS